MRRGGRAVYAFDVTDPTSPVLKWRKGCFTDDTAAASPVCSTDTDTVLGDWTRIGQTWSKPQFGYLSGYVAGDGTTLKPVLVFGGGYDTCEDADNQTRCTGTRKGADIWFVDADSGAVIARYPTNYSVPGEVFLMKNNEDVIKTAYAADTGGYVYRIDVGSYSSSSSPKLAATKSTIASLSETNQARKFFFGPDVTAYPGFNAVLIGSGDREHPLYTDYACNSGATSPPGGFVTNRFFMVKDAPPAIPTTPITVGQLTDADSGDPVNDYGWQFGLRACEQVVNKPLTIGGLTYFGTNQPKFDAAPVCEPDLGTARSYVVDFLNGAPWCGTCARDVAYEGGGMPPSPVAGVVTVDGVKVPFLLGGSKPPPGGGPCVGDGCSSLGGGKVPINPTGPRYRVWWNMIKD
jgi:type IV pilus assembly protein PilY1